MPARMRVIPLPRDEYGIIFDRCSESDGIPPRIPELDEGGRVTRHKPVDMKGAMGAKFVAWFDAEIDLEATP